MTKIGKDRRYFIGGSDARIIMGDDEGALIRLWREKRGEAEPERSVGSSTTSSGTLPSHYLSALLGRGRSWSGESLSPPRSCWKVCRRFPRVVQPISSLQSAARAGYWGRPWLLNSSFEHRDGILRVLGTPNDGGPPWFRLTPLSLFLRVWPNCTI